MIECHCNSLLYMTLVCKPVEMSMLQSQALMSSATRTMPLEAANQALRYKYRASLPARMTQDQMLALMGYDQVEGVGQPLALDTRLLEFRLHVYTWRCTQSDKLSMITVDGCYL